MTKQKRKGSDFRAASIATVTSVQTRLTTASPAGSINSSHDGRSSLSPTQIKAEWQALQETLRQLRDENTNTTTDNTFGEEEDPVLQTIRQLQKRPLVLQERVENLLYEAADIPEHLDTEWSEME